MKNPFRTRAKHEVFGATKYYIVKYRKWWQQRWHTLRGRIDYYPWLGSEAEAKNVAENINKGIKKI